MQSAVVSAIFVTVRKTVLAGGTLVEADDLVVTFG